jgi:ribonuclease-3
VHVELLEKLLDHEFQQKKLAAEALTDPSYPMEWRPDGQKGNRNLAYIGDAVLEVVLRSHQVTRDGMNVAMTDEKQRLVSNKSLGIIAINRGFPDLLARSSTHSNPDSNTKIWADAFEAAIGAVFLDSGYEVAARVAVSLLGDDLESLSDSIG